MSTTRTARRVALVAGGTLAATLAVLPTTSATAASSTPAQAHLSRSNVAPMGADCGGVTNPCGIVYNRTGHSLELARDADSHLNCNNPGKKRRSLPAGKNSNSYGSPHWPDVDCVRSKTHGIVTNGRYYSPGTWIRVWTPKWIY